MTANQQAIWAVAQKVGADLGIDPSILYGQWTGAENGPANAGRLVPPGGQGAYNLAGIEMPGTTQYATYSSLAQFGAAYENVIKGNFPGAVGAGSDAKKFVAGLTNSQGQTYYGTGITAAAYLANLEEGMATVAGMATGSAGTASTGTLSQWTPTPLQNLQMWMDNTFGTHFYSPGLGGDTESDVNKALQAAAGNGTPNTPAFNDLAAANAQQAASQAVASTSWLAQVGQWITQATRTAGLYVVGVVLVVLGVVILLAGNKTVQQVVKDVVTK